MDNAKQLYLHIGWPKTGTTALQDFCHRNRALLGAHGLAYYTTRAELAGSIPRTIAKREPMAPERARLLDWAARQAAPKVLISSEGFADCDLTALTEFLAPEAWQSVTVIAYLRPQDAFLEGWYKQIVKWGGKLTLDRYLAPENPVWAQADYAARLDRWADWCARLPHGRLIPAIYDRRDLRGGNIGPDVFARLGLDDLTPEIGGSNVSPSAALIGLYLRLPPIDRLQQVNRAIVATGLRGTTGSGDLMSPAWRAAIAARFAAGNEALRARHFPDRPALFAPRPAPPEIAVPHDALKALLIDMLDRMRGPEVAAQARAALA